MLREPRSIAIMSRMGAAVKDLWDLTFGQPCVDAEELAAALESEL